MPFDAGGTFTRSYNWQADRDAGVKILAQRMDGEFNNYAGGLNQTFLRTGIVPMGGPLNMNSNPIVGIAGGTLITPGLRFESDTDTGIMQSGPGNLTLVVDGIAKVTATAGNVAIAGPMSVGGALTVNSITSTGGLTISAPLMLPDGAVGAPAMAFSSVASTGIWHVGSGAGESLNITVGGSNRISVQPTITVYNGSVSVAANIAAASLNISGAASVVVGGLTVSSGLAVTGGISATGDVNAPSFHVDSQFGMYNQAGPVPTLSFDANDFMAYTRTTNQLGVFVSSVQQLTVSPSGVLVPGTLSVGDYSNGMYISGGNPITIYDGNDYSYFDRTNNLWTMIIGAVGRFTIATTGVTATGNLNVSGTGYAAAFNTNGSGGVGYATLNNGTTVNSGLVAFYRSDGNRHGYIGYAPGPNGIITYANDQNGGHSFTGGIVITSSDFTSSGIISSGSVIRPGGDAQYFLDRNGGAPLIAFDANDYTYYDRTNNAWNFVIGGAVVHVINANASLVPLGGAGGTMVDVGYKFHQEVTFGTSQTVTTAWADRVWYYNGPAGNTITLPNGCPSGMSFEFINNGAGSINFTTSGGVTLYAFTTASGTFQSGNRFMFNNLAKYTITCFASGSAWLITAPQGGGLA